MLSIVIPAYNENTNMSILANNLASLNRDVGVELIVADGGSCDGTADAARVAFSATFGYRSSYNPERSLRTSWKVIESQKGRAIQMNAGAGEARGDVLLFLHADSRLPSDAPQLIGDALRGGAKAGCFKLRFEPSSPLLRATAFMSDMRVKYRGIAFGDQGIFVTRTLFNKLGGFPPIPLMEDYSFSEKLSKETRIALLHAQITTSSRRFQKNGILRTLIKMQYVQHLWRKGINVEKIADIYRR